jgi:hypothetical protein
VKNYLVGAVYALATAFVAVLLPMTMAVGPIRRPTNLLLGAIYGFGWFVASFIDVRFPKIETFGWLVWPLIIIVLITYILGRLLSSFPDRAVAIAACAIILLFLIVPGDLVSTTFLKHVPTYSSILLSIY